ncbi:MAG: hypothetical protein PWP76_547 [Candidatus Diapherotrites archaeon]|nr:hypothetical protein [Candidatus Diapherotrites archaeon]MDN5367047.1 hypothetical protein [Candidatus Diapherotrites archaeon]
MLAVRGRFREIFAIYVATLLLALFFAWPPPPEVPPEGESPGTAGLFFTYVILATLAFLAIIRLWPWLLRHILAFLEIVFLFSTTALITVSYNLPVTLPYLAVTTRIIWWRNYIVQNISTAIIASVATAVVGMGLSPGVAAALLAIFAIYDYVSVFVTKHMVTLARALGATADEEGRVRKVSEIHMLGAGDIVIPGIFSVSLLRVGLLPALLSVFGAVVGLFWTMNLARRWKRVLPALPSIALPELCFAAVGITLSLFL